jgi:hypothetical protein
LEIVPLSRCVPRLRAPKRVANIFFCFQPYSLTHTTLSV